MYRHLPPPPEAKPEPKPIPKVEPKPEPVLKKPDIAIKEEKKKAGAEKAGAQARATQAGTEKARAKEAGTQAGS